MAPETLAALDRLAAEVPREELPALLGAVVTAEARIRLRLAEAAVPAVAAVRIIDGDEGAAIAGTSARWLLKATAGMAFRCDLNRKRPRFREDGLRAWLTTRGSR